MATISTHHGIKIVALDEGEHILDHCGEDEIAVVKQDDGWWTYFVGPDGEVEGYDEPFESLNRALGAARAAAEIMAESNRGAS